MRDWFRLKVMAAEQIKKMVQSRVKILQVDQRTSSMEKAMVLKFLQKRKQGENASKELQSMKALPLPFFQQIQTRDPPLLYILKITQGLVLFYFVLSRQRTTFHVKLSKSS